MSFTIRSGETIALVGPAGCGKSTIVDLLLRLHDPDQGTISIGGTPIDRLRRDFVRSRIAVVMQQPFLYSRSIRDNIAYGRLGATDEEIMAAARSAQFDSVIAQLPDGLDTMIGERGVKLSGGQRQRLAIARALLNDPEIIVFDEATSDVDTETEELIQESLERLVEERTAFIIAHRLSTIQNADEIVVMDQGQIVEQNEPAEFFDNPQHERTKLFLSQILH